MGSVLDSIMKRIEVPDKISLSSTDREMLEKINTNLQDLSELKDLKDLKDLNELRELKDLKGLKEIIEKQSIRLDEEIESLKEAKNSDEVDSITSSIQLIKEQNEKIISTLDTFADQIQAMDKSLNKQISGVKIMTGFAIWSSLLGVAVLIAYVLGFV